MDPRFERKVFIKNILKTKPNYSIAPTSMYEGFLEEKINSNIDLSFFNYPFEGGEPLPKEIAQKIETVFKSHGSNSKLRVAYGQCEAGAAITTQTQKMEHEEGSVGIPLPGIVIGIFDDNDNELPYYERGNILANTPCRMKEYYKNIEATNEYFYVDKNGQTWNRTGDIGYINEKGELFVQGRASDYTKVNEKKIFNFDIENIVRLQSGIKICEVLSTKDANNQEQLAVHIILNDEARREIEADNEVLNEKISSIQKLIYDTLDDLDMVPSYFKIWNSFPYAKSGKRDTLQMQQETSGLLYYDKHKILKDYKQKIKEC